MREIESNENFTSHYKYKNRYYHNVIKLLHYLSKILAANLIRKVNSINKNKNKIQKSVELKMMSKGKRIIDSYITERNIIAYHHAASAADRYTRDYPWCLPGVSESNAHNHHGSK